jgi:hypothetical protein
MYSGRLQPHDASISPTRTRRVFRRLPQLVGLTAAMVLACGGALQQTIGLCRTICLLLFVLFDGRRWKGFRAAMGPGQNHASAAVLDQRGRGSVVHRTAGEDGGLFRDYLALAWSVGFRSCCRAVDTRAFCSGSWTLPSRRSVVIAVNLWANGMAHLGDPQLGMSFKASMIGLTLGTGAKVASSGLSDLGPTRIKAHRRDLHRPAHGSEERSKVAG